MDLDDIALPVAPATAWREVGALVSVDTRPGGIGQPSGMVGAAPGVRRPGRIGGIGIVLGIVAVCSVVLLIFGALTGV